MTRRHHGPCRRSPSVEQGERGHSPRGEALPLDVPYLWALLGLFVLNEKVTLRQHGIDFSPHRFALINALILAKAMLVAEDLNLGARLQPRPLIYPILTEAFILAVLFIVFHVLEEMVVGLVAGKGIAASVPTIGGGGVVGLACVALILSISLVPYFGFRRVSRELGPGKMQELLLGPPGRNAGSPSL